MLDFTVRGAQKKAPIATATEAGSLAVATAVADMLYVPRGDFFFLFLEQSLLLA